MATAITYARNQWQALCVYGTQGFLNIDNNASERALKRVAIGRKNWPFAGHDAAAANHARLWSLIASAERHGLDPQRYLTSVFAKIGTTRLADLGQFLPDVWKKDDAAESPTLLKTYHVAGPMRSFRWRISASHRTFQL
jgi:transposase